jgi:hypothetical protein
MTVTIALEAYSEKVCAFARLCQAAYLLGQVERHHLHPIQPEQQQFFNASALYRDITSLTHTINEEARAMPDADYLAYATPLAVSIHFLDIACL